MTRTDAVLLPEAGSPLDSPAASPRPGTGTGSHGRWSRIRAFGKPPRLMGVDVARGVAVLGMLGAHVGLGGAGFDWATPQTWGGVVDGRSSILFAVVAGVSLALMTRGLDRDDADAVRTARLRLIGRGLAVFAIGIALELLNTPIAVILPIYGVLFVIAAPLLTVRTRTLVIGAAASAVVVPAVLGALSVLSAGASGAGVAFALNGVYPIPVWIAFLLAGLAVGRMPLHTLRTQLALLAVGAVLAAVGYGAAALAGPLIGSSGESSAVTASGSSSASGSTDVDPDAPSDAAPADRFDFDGLLCKSVSGLVACAPPEKLGMPSAGSGSGDHWAEIAASDPGGTIGRHWLDTSPHSGGALEIVGAGGLAMAVLALALLAARPLRWVLIPVAALGSMPLTAYTAHLLLFVGGWFPLPDPLLSWALAGSALLVLTTAWALWVGRGPLERLTARAGAAFARVEKPVRARTTTATPAWLARRTMRR